MKNLLPIIILMLANFMTSTSQNLAIGFKTGFGVSNIHITNIDEFDGNSGIFSTTFSYSANGFLDYKSNGIWGISIEPGVVKKGWNTNNRENEVKIHYFQLPILSNFFISKKIFLSIGPEINYNLSAKSVLSSGIQKVSDVFNKFELSGVAGISYKIADNIDVGFRYSHGITEMTDKMFWIPVDNIENLVEMKNDSQYLQLSLRMKLKNWR